MAAITVPSGVEISPKSFPTIFSAFSDDFATISIASALPLLRESAVTSSFFDRFFKTTPIAISVGAIVISTSSFSLIKSS